MVCEEAQVAMQFRLENEILNRYLEADYKPGAFYADNVAERA